MNPRTFRDRREAGQLLASKLAAYANRPDVIGESCRHRWCLPVRRMPSAKVEVTDKHRDGVPQVRQFLAVANGATCEPAREGSHAEIGSFRVADRGFF